MKNNAILIKISNLILDILIFLFGIILFISVYNFIQVKVMNKNHSEFFGYSFFEVKTGSMADTINQGDCIIVKRTSNHSVKDIITYYKDGAFITHRIIEVSGDTYVTKGDFNNAKDEGIRNDQIIGTVVKILPSFGTIRKLCFNPIIIFTLIVTFYIITFLLRGKKVAKNSVSAKVLKKFANEDILSKYIEDYDNILDESELIVKPIKQVNYNKKIVNNYLSDDKMDKTVFYRSIEVNQEDIDNLELKKEEEKKEKILSEIEQDIGNALDEEVNSLMVADKLKDLQKKKKAFKTILEKVIFIKTEEIEDILMILNKGEKYKLNEPSIKDTFLKNYIDGKYYNFCGNINVEYNKKNVKKKIEDSIAFTKESLIKAYKGNDNKYSEKVYKFEKYFNIITILDKSHDVITEEDNYIKKLITMLKNDNIDNKSIRKMLKEIVEKQKVYNKIIDNSIKKMESNTFNLTLKPIANEKDLFGVSLDHNINFSKVYSDYIIDKTYDDGIIAEEKLFVIINLLTTLVSTNILEGNFKDHYVLYLPYSLIEKENKSKKVLSLLEDENIKNLTYLLVTYETFKKFNKEITKLKNAGYKFAILFENDKTREKSFSMVSICDYIFMDKELKNNKEFMSKFTADIKKQIIVDDAYEKLGIFKGE